MASSDNPIAKSFDIFNPVRLQSTVLEEIWHQAYGSDYAVDAKPGAFYPLSVLQRIVTLAEADSSTNAGVTDMVLLDIGCGHGLTSLFLAEQLKCKVFGIDVSAHSVEVARENASTRKNPDAKYWVADAAHTDLEDCVCSLVTCLDVLLYVADKPAAFREIYRVLRRGGLFAFTTWEQTGYNERLGALQVNDYRPLLIEAGFEIEHYDEVAGSREQQARMFDDIIARQDDLEKDIGEKTTSMFVDMAKSAKSESGGRRYVFAIARRKD